MTAPFFQPGLASEPYEAVRDCAHRIHLKERIEALWSIYAPYADLQFLDDAKHQFHQRTWEMYVGCVLIQHRLEPKKVSDQGPEFYIVIGGKKVWIEAIAAEPGQGPDAVPPLPNNPEVAQPVPEKEILLRLTNALDVKWKKYTNDVGKGIIHADDCYVIALNGWGASNGRPEPNGITYLFKAVLGFGDSVVFFDPENQTPPKSSYQWRDQLVKKSGSPVSTTAFLSAAYEGINAILYGHEDICNVPSVIGSEMFCLHNPHAKNPLPSGAFRFGTEYRYDLTTGKIEHQDWSPPHYLKT